MQGRFIFLGTSASTGIPVIGCQCSVCLSDSPLNQRTRTAALLEFNGKYILIDIGPDFRTQALRHRITHLEGVMITHTHYDHIGGIDDLRPLAFASKKPLPMLVSKETMDDLEKRYGYLIHGEKQPKFDFHILEKEEGKTTFLGISLQYFSYHQSGMGVTGYRFGDLAFVTDIKDYSGAVIKALAGCQTLIISALDWKPTRAHLGIEEVLNLAESLEAHRVILTHIGHELDHESTNAKLPKYVELAYDGMSIECHL